MKVLLYFENQKMLDKSGIGRALKHQQRALEQMGIEYTVNSRTEDYDILHINTYGIKSLKMIRKARKLGKKVIYHGHSTEEDFRNSFIGSNQIAPLFKRYLVLLYSQADQLITPTPYSKRLLEGYGLTMPIHAISNGIDLAKYEPSTTKEAKFRDYFHLDAHQKVVISVGLYFERKGIIDFIELAKRFPQYTFIWFGHTPLYTIPRKIRKLVRNHPKNVIFPGYIAGEIIEGAYSGADLFFFPSYEETEGIVVLEALASKQKIVVRNIPVYEQWLTNQENCFMGQNCDEFEQLISGVLEERLPDLTENGYQTAVSRSIDSIGIALKEVYQSVLVEEVSLEEYR